MLMRTKAIATLSNETNRRLADQLIGIQNQINAMENQFDAIDLPATYDELVRQRDAAERLLGMCR